MKSMKKKTLMKTTHKLQDKMVAKLLGMSYSVGYFLDRELIFQLLLFLYHIPHVIDSNIV